MNWTVRGVLGAAVYAFLLLSNLEGASAQECFPPCRSGYTCSAGHCVSACNPSCTAGQICTAEGTCAADPASAAPQPAPAPSPKESAEEKPPLWGPGSQSSGGQVWSPQTAPPSPLSEAEQRRRAARTRLRPVVYFVAGATVEEFFAEPNIDSPETTLLGGLGFGIRKNLATYFGLQGRLLVEFDSPNYESWSNPEGWQTSGYGLGVIVNGGPRLGPFGGFYLGPVLGYGFRFLNVEVGCDAAADSCWHDGSALVDGELLPVPDSYSGLNLGADIGFILGDEEQFDLSLQYSTLNVFADDRWQTLNFMFGWATN